MSNWKNANNKLTKTFHFNNNKLKMHCVNQVMMLGKEQNQHPDINVVYSMVEITITAHEKRDISEKCHRLKDMINKLEMFRNLV